MGIDFSSVLPEVIAGLLISAILGISHWFKMKLKKNNSKILKEKKELNELIKSGNDCLYDTKAKKRRDFVKKYKLILEEDWPPKFLNLDEIDICEQLLGSSRSHYNPKQDVPISKMIQDLEELKKSNSIIFPF